MSTVTRSNWEWFRYDRTKIVNHQLSSFGDPVAYQYRTVPAQNEGVNKSTSRGPDGKGPESTDGKWIKAPSNDGGNSIYMDFVSRLSTVKEQIDFAYFRTLVKIPDPEIIEKFEVKINAVDDGARVYLYNSKYPTDELAYHEPEHDAQLVFIGSRLQSGKSKVDLTKHIVSGDNYIVIVQFDCAKSHNQFTGGVDIQVTEKGQTTPTTIQGTEEVKTTTPEWVVIPGFELDFNGKTFLVQPIEKKYNYDEALDLASKRGDDWRLATIEEIKEMGSHLPQEWRDHADRVWSSSPGKAVNIGKHGYGRADNSELKNACHVVLIKEKN